MSEPHSHPEIEDRITAEMALVRTDLAALGGRIDAVAQIAALTRRDVAGLGGDLAGLRREINEGFTTVVQAIEQLAAQIPGAEPEGS